MFAEAWFDDAVFLGARPADVNDGAHGDVVIRVDVGDMDLAGYLIHEEGVPPWEYVVPAGLLNALPSDALVVLNEDELDALDWAPGEEL